MSAEESSDPVAHPPRLLLIEDSPSDMTLLEVALRDSLLKLATIERESSLHASLKRLAHCEFDGILLDLGLPDSDGIDTFRRVADAAGRAAIVVVTGRDDATLGEEAVRLGAQDYLFKTELGPGKVGRAVAYAIRRQEAKNESDRAQQRQIAANVQFLTQVSRELRSPLSVVQQLASLLFKGVAGSLSADQQELVTVLMENVEQLEAAETATRAARADAEQANAAKDRFLSRLSHELRTPLNAVLGFAQILELSELTGEQSRAVWHVLDGGRHLLGLIDDLLDLTKMASQDFDLHLEPVQVEKLLTETVDLMSSISIAADITLHLDIDSCRDHYATADDRRLRQVVLNLLSNAIKYNRPGGRVDIRCAQSDPTRIDIAVSDTGIGIRPEDLPRLFLPFDRLGVQSRGIEGTGIGLTLSQRMMTTMGGSLRAESQARVGSIFTASLPLAPALDRSTR